MNLDPGSLRFVPSDARDQALLTVLVQVACGDGRVTDEELRLFEGMLPGTSPVEVAGMMVDLAGERLDAGAIAEALPTEADRLLALELAARMAWCDAEVTTAEKLVLLELCGAFGFESERLEAILDGVIGRARAEVDPRRLVAALEATTWEDVVVEPRDPRDPWLQALAPPPFLARLALDGVDVAAIHGLGLAATFRSGPELVRWANIAAWSRVPVFGSAVKIRTHDGRVLTIGEPRLRVLGSLLDRLFA